MSNSLIAAFSAFGFVSASTRRTVYLVFGIFAAVFSLIVGFLFLTGQEARYRTSRCSSTGSSA